jgi:hypothetical protein
MSTTGSDNNLAQAFKDLSIKWQETKYFWNDVKSREFEQRFLDALPEQIARATNVIGEIEVLLRKVRHDCE